ncbi:MAG TPA: hypothetical protein VIS78_08080 [Blastocatellia bacterium]
MSNDLTVPPTQPTLETILGRINALGESLSAEIVKVRTDLSAEIAKVRSDLSAEIQSFRAETLEKLAKIDEKFEVITDDLLEIRAKQKQHGKRLNELERKVS